MARKNPNLHRILQRDEVFGLKRIIAFVHALANKNYYDVENLCCGRVTRVTQPIVLKGRQCDECRRKGMKEEMNRNVINSKFIQGKFEW